MTRRTAFILAFGCVALAALGAADLALAQGGPFGTPRAPGGGAPPPAADGVVGWILAKQAEFYRQLSGLVRQAKADGTAVWGLLGVSFLYGIFHAAGPGHGKAVISSYIIANNETWKRGVVLSFASAFVQALAAVALVGIVAAFVTGLARREAMTQAVRWIEIASYALIAVLGARLVWSKGRAFLASLRALQAPGLTPALAGHPHEHAHHDHDHHAHHAHDHDDHHHHEHHTHAAAANAPHGHSDHVHDEHCGHSHGPTPDQLAGPGGWQRGLSAIFAVGLRPCSGAILVLVFALAQGLFWAGVAATFAMGLGTAIAVAGIATMAVGAKDIAMRLAEGRGGYGTLALRGIEVAAAVLVLAFGVLLLMGYIASERLGLA